MLFFFSLAPFLLFHYPTQLQEMHDVPLRNITARRLLNNLPSYAPGATRSNDTLRALHHLAQRTYSCAMRYFVMHLLAHTDNCLAKQDGLRHCTDCAKMFFCCICYDTASTPVVTTCLHIFCALCIRQHLETTSAATAHRGERGTCPLCAHDIVVDELLYLSPAKNAESGEYWLLCGTGSRHCISSEEAAVENDVPRPSADVRPLDA